MKKTQIRLMKRLAPFLVIVTFLIGKSIAQNAPTVVDESFTIDEYTTQETGSFNGTIIGTVSAEDLDADVLTFSITSGNSSGAFRINSVTGVISVANETILDYESIQSLTLTIEVSDDEIPAQTGSGIITINLNNISPNDFCTNAITVMAGTTVAGSTHDATGDAAIAPTCGSNPVEPDLSVGVWYHFVGTGEKITVETCGAADYDTAIGVYTGSCSTGLSCVSGNDDGSSCTGFTSRTSFISVLDQDYYILIDGYQDDFGNFNLTTTAEPAPTPPDNDNCTDAQVLTVFAEGTGTPTNGDNTTATTFTEVVFCDRFGTINDVWYTFNSGPNVEVSIDIQLVDTDDAGPLNAAGYVDFEVYEECGGAQTDYCGNDGTSNLTVVPNTDYYLQLWNNEDDFGTFTIQINDGPNTAATVTSSNVSLSRYASNADLVSTVTATDTENHSQILSIIAGNDEGIFAIDQVSGEVIVVDDAALQSSVTTQFILTVEAADQGPGTLTSTGTLTIDIIDNQFPSISAAVVALDENSTNTTSVITVVANDADMDNLGFSILSGNTGNAFTIDALGEITVADEMQLNFETNPTFDLEVQVTDDGPLTLSAKAIITINLNDLNEMPVVGSAVTNISQNNANGYELATIGFTDEDANQSHTFSISAGNTNSIFDIDPISGVVTIVNDIDLSANGATTYNLTIEVSDNGTPVNVGTGTLTVNAFSNNAPTVTPETFMVDENTVNTTPVGTVSANDADGNGITFTIYSGNDLGAFSITPAGEIQVADVTKLDFETNPSFNLNIQAQDDGAGILSSTGLITIELNNVNEAPSLSNTTLNMSSSSTNGAEVSTLTGTDPENDVLTYSITSGNDAGVFGLDASTGQLSIANSSLLNPAITPQYTLTVEVSDGALTGTATIMVNIYLNEAPVLSLTTLSLDENSSADHVIGTLTSNDADGIQSYAIVAGNDADIVALDGSTGVLAVKDATYFNYEDVQSFDISVRLTDNGLGNLQTTETVTISLNDVNEFSPVVSSSVNPLDENATSGTVAAVSATDDDVLQTLSYSIASGNIGAAFSIDNSGVITISNSAALDFETNPSFNLIVDVSDSGTPSNETSENLTITLTDVNEAPVLSAIGDQMGTEQSELTFAANASDEDLPANTLQFSLDATSSGNGMMIDVSTGVFTWTPDHTQAGTYTVEVTVTDGSLSDSESISISISDVLGVSVTEGIEVYPNPSSEFISVKSEEVKSVVFYNLDGVKILEASDQKEINISDLKTGTYMLQLIDKNDSVIGISRVIKR